MPLYEEKLISPLAIRFSQPRIRSTFRDGHTLEETLAQVSTVTAPADSAYDAVLAAPFPPIEVVRWRPKLRDADGSALSDETGESLRGEECWFTLDNRRLYCLQNAAAQGLPHSIAAVVRVMYDIPTVKSIARKFKTTTSGSSVKVAAHHDEVPICTWGWQSSPQVTAVHAQGTCSGIAQMQKDVETRDHARLEDAPLDSGLYSAPAFECAKSTDDSSCASEPDSSNCDDVSQHGVDAKKPEAPSFVYEAGATLRSMFNQGADTESVAGTSRRLHQQRQVQSQMRQHEQHHQLLVEEYLAKNFKQQQQEYLLRQHQQRLRQQQLLLETQQMASAQQLWLMQRQQELMMAPQLWSQQQQLQLQQQQQQQTQQPQQTRSQATQSLFSQLKQRQHSMHHAAGGAPWEDSNYSWWNEYGLQADTEEGVYIS
jgi:hypothetical protein